MIEEWVQSLPANFFAEMESPQEVLARGLERLRAMGYAIPDPDSLLHHWQRLPEGSGDGSGPADLTRDPPWPKGGFREMVEANRAKWNQEGGDGSDGDEAEPNEEPQALQATPRSLQTAPENPRHKKCECGRFVIGTASGAYCCPRCRDTQGVSHSARCEADTAALDRLGAIAVREKELAWSTPGRRMLPGVYRFEATTFLKRANSSRTMRLTPEVTRATGAHLEVAPPTRWEDQTPGRIESCPECRASRLAKTGDGWGCTACGC
jgi:hypothetical protein